MSSEGQNGALQGAAIMNKSVYWLCWEEFSFSL